MEKSSFGSLTGKDFVKGLILAFLTALTTAASAWINRGSFPTTTELLFALKIAGFAAIAYVVKNFFTNSRDEFLVGDPPIYSYSSKNDFPLTGVESAYYKDNSTGKFYTWDGRNYVEFTGPNPGPR